MGEQTVRTVIRASVLTSTFPLVLACILGRSELRSGSGTFDALTTYTGAVCLVAALPLWRPKRPTLLAFWGIGAFASLCFVLFRNPYAYGEDPIRALTFLLEVTQPLLMLLPVIIAVWISLRPATVRRARRLRVVAALAGLVALGGQLAIVGLGSRAALGFQLAAKVLAGTMLWPAVVVAWTPSLRHAWLWVGWTLVCGFMAVQINRELPADKGWQLETLFGSFGLLFALALVVVPLVVLTTREPSAALTTARVVHERSDDDRPA